MPLGSTEQEAYRVVVQLYSPVHVIHLCQMSGVRGQMEGMFSAAACQIELPASLSPDHHCKPFCRQIVQCIHHCNDAMLRTCQCRKPEDTGKQNAACSSIEANQPVQERLTADEASKASLIQSSDSAAALPAVSHTPGKCSAQYFCAQGWPAQF